MSTENLSKLIEKRLAAKSLKILDIAAVTASEIDMKVYLVGGVVRDILLGRDSHDLDIVVEGDAMELAYEFAEAVRGKVTVHPRFRTATVKWDGQSVDLVTARSETYAKPGALPTIQPGTIEDDLKRRDFTVNAMAAGLSPDDYGKLIDPFNGRSDLDKKGIRILHEESFIDDPTRIWRAVRYEQRLGFTIEPETLSLLKQDLPMLAAVSGDRIRHELELVLQEAAPEKALRRAGELSLLRTVQPGLEGDDRLTELFIEARKTCTPDTPSVELYLALLAYRLSSNRLQDFIHNLNLRKKQVSVLNEMVSLKKGVKKLSQPEIKPSTVYRLLNGYSQTALAAVTIAEDDLNIRKNVTLYTEKLNKVKTSLTGNDLKDMGITSGPEIKKTLEKLLTARLDGKVTSRRGETEMVNTIR